MRAIAGGVSGAPSVVPSLLHNLCDLADRHSLRPGEREAGGGLLCIAFCIAAHSITDVPVACLFDIEDLVGIPDDDEGEDKSKRATGAAPATTQMEESTDART
ncbi:hypothetical protein [Streptomyces milbemycinicus]|uniref:Uncharacterized protein n=1 Tax=Streptomyces milbemycinicus TaxID=476552 RepID=A0ABW8M0P4_9ACTN